MSKALHLTLAKWSIHTVNIRGVRIGEASGAVPVASKPYIKTVVVLAIPSRGDISIDIGAAKIVTYVFPCFWLFGLEKEWGNRT